MRQISNLFISRTAYVRSRIAVTLVMALCMSHSSSIAADWLQLDRNADGDTLSIDSTSIERNGIVVRYTEQLVFVRPRQTQRHGLLKSMRTRYAVNCKDQTNAPLLLQAISTTGEVIGLTPVSMANPEFIPIAENPRAADRIAFNYLCARK